MFFLSADAWQKESVNMSKQVSKKIRFGDPVRIWMYKKSKKKDEKKKSVVPGELLKVGVPDRCWG